MLKGAALENIQDEPVEVQDLDIREKAKEICLSLVNEVLDNDFEEEFREEIKAKIRNVMLEVLEEESQALLQHKKTA